jgi:hypothetical protein
MNTLPRLQPSLPFCYQDGSFQVILRNAESAAVFWDLPEEPILSKTEGRLCLRIAAIDEAGERSSEVLILHHEAGQAFVPLAPIAAGCETYRFTLGWVDGVDFFKIAEDELLMPMLDDAVDRAVQQEAVEGHGFHPLSMTAMST